MRPPTVPALPERPALHPGPATTATTVTTATTTTTPATTTHTSPANTRGAQSWGQLPPSTAALSPSSRQAAEWRVQLVKVLENEIRSVL
jgi:hypothetical protein